jgi:hypothetical protein
MKGPAVILGLVLPLLAACAGAPVEGPGGGPGLSARQAEPRAAILYPGTLNVLTSDGGLCAGVRPRGAQAWSGRLQGCRADLSYAVARPARGAREVLPAIEDPGADPSGAAVTVEGPGGVWAFGMR